MSTAVETMCDGCGRPLGATAILVGGQRFHALCVPARVPMTPEEARILAGLRDGTLVAVPRPVFPPRFWSSGLGPGEVRYYAVEWPLATKAERDAMLAAAVERASKEPPHA